MSLIPARKHKLFLTPLQKTDNVFQGYRLPKIWRGYRNRASDT